MFRLWLITILVGMRGILGGKGIIVLSYVFMLLLLFVWPPVGGGFLSLPPRLHSPKGQHPKFSRREYCWEVSKSHYAGVPCVPLSVTSLRHIRISTYMLTLVMSEVPRSLSRRKPRRFLRTHSRSVFQDTKREKSYPMVLRHVDACTFSDGCSFEVKVGGSMGWVRR